MTNAMFSDSGKKAAVDEDVTEIVRELTGEAKARTRSGEAWQAAARRVVEALLAASSWPGVEGSPWRRLDEIVHRAMAPGAGARRRALVDTLGERFDRASGLDERIFILRELEVAGGEESIAVLARALEDRDPVIREYAVRALEANPSAAAGAPLLKALEQATEPPWRLALVNALGSRREPASVSVLGDILRGETDDEVASAVRLALGNIGTTAAVETLEAGGTELPGADRGNARRARLLAAGHLLESGHREEASAIFETVHREAADPHIRLAALRGVLLADPGSAVHLLLDALRSGDVSFRTSVARLIPELQSESALAAIRRALPDLPEPARRLVEDALGP